MEALENRLTPVNHSPTAPVITEPISNGVVVNGSDVHMVIDTFQDQDVGDLHAATDWQIWTTGGGAQVVWQANGMTETVMKFHIHLGDGTFVNSLAGRFELDFDKDYRLQVRVKDNSSDPTTEWSAWSNRTFHTSPAIQPIPGVGIWAVDQPGFKVEKVATGFQLPVNIAFVPNPGEHPNDPLFYVTELYGNIKMVTRAGAVSNYATGLLNFNPTGQFPGSGEQGVAGIAVDFFTGDLFVTLLYDAGGPHYPKIIRMHSNDGGRTVATITDVLLMPNEPMGQSHQISNISFGPDLKLYVHVGDGFDSSTPQNLNSFRGKVLRMNIDGTAPSDNPFYNAGDGITARDYVFAYGFRNPFGGVWRDRDSSHYEVENGPSIDRLAKVVAGRNYGFNGTDASMTNFAIYNWNPAHAPVNAAFIQNSVFNDSRFPAFKMDHLFVALSGPTFANGPVSNGKEIHEFTLDMNGNLVTGPTNLIHYNGTGRATVVALAAGPDGLYFSDLYNDTGSNPVAPGANVFRVKWIGGAAPVAPATLDAVAVSNSRINLSWANTSDNEDGFRIEQSTNGVNFIQIASVGPNETDFPVVGLQTGVTYHFRVRAFNNDFGNGGYSPIDSTTTLSGATVPAAPSDLDGLAISNTEVDLHWESNSDDENGFYIEQSLNPNSGFSRIGTVAAGEDHFQVPGLQLGTTYFFRVQAFNSAGESDYSNTASVTTLSRLPAVPTGLTATAGIAQVALSWQPAVDAVSYSVFRSTVSNGQGATPLASNIVTTSFTDAAVTNGVTYFYKVRAVNSLGSSGFSTEAFATPTQPPFAANINFQPNGAPIPAGYLADIGGVFGNRNGLTYGWSQDRSGDTRDRNDPAAPDQRYDTLVHVAPAVWEIAVPNGSYSVRLVAGDPSYLDSVHRVNVEGVLTINFTPSVNTLFQDATISVTVTDGRLTVAAASGAVNPKINFIEITANAPPIAPAAPTNLQATAAANQVLLTWTASAGAASYRVYRGTTSGGQSPTPIATGLTGTTFTDTGLTNGVTYFYKVSAVNSAGESPLSNEASATPQPPPVPAVPTGLTATAGVNQVALTWNAASGATSYRVYRGTTSGGQSPTPIATGLTATAFTDTGLTNGVTYFYKVTAVNSAGESPASNEAFATPQPPPVPAAPTGLTATAGVGQVALTWNASSGATSYRVYRGTVSGGQSPTPIATGLTSTNYTDSGLTAGTTYFYKVSAVNGTGESGLSNEAFATPTAPPAFTAKINFQPSNAPIPAGYFADTGAVYAARNGLTYGWSQNSSGETRDRNLANSPDQRYDTLTHLSIQVWEIAVPNASYSVHIVSGDPGYTDSVHRITVEGLLAINGTTSAANMWLEATVTVTVADGRLTVRTGTGAVNAKLNYIDITSAASAAAQQSGAPVALQQTVTPALTGSATTEQTAATGPTATTPTTEVQGEPQANPLVGSGNKPQAPLKKKQGLFELPPV